MPNYRRASVERTCFFTLLSHRRRPILCEPLFRKVLKEKLAQLRRHRPFDIDALVLMPDQLHCIWTLPHNDPEHDLRQRWLTQEVAKAVLEHRPRKLLRTKLWQKKSFGCQIRSNAGLRAHYDFIHYAPVQHQLVESPADWPWPTVHRFIADGVYSVNWAVDGIGAKAGIGRE